MAGVSVYGMGYAEPMSEFDLNALLEQAQKVQGQVQELQRHLADQEVEGSAGGGMVKVTMTGAQRVTRVTIDPSVTAEDREMLQDLIVAACNQAIDKTRELAQKLTEQQLSGFLPPGLIPPGGFPGL